ncbi:MAG: UDP-N-acetylmuramoyl-tripeptide--D-alanyl-D-alanine ligase [Trueperaceae bacterium]
MPTLSAQFIAEIGGTKVASSLSATSSLSHATGVSFSTHYLEEGQAFFALPGENTHGITYAADALARGAAFIVSDKPHPMGIQVKDAVETLLDLGRWARAERKGAVVGVTGSAGKTSTRTFITNALEAKSSTGNLNTPFALASILVNTLLAHGAQQHLVLEMGIDHSGEMDTLVGLVQPTHGVLTLVAPSHLEGLGSVENVAREKAKLLESAGFKLASEQTKAFLDDLGVTSKFYGLSELADFRGTYANGVLTYKNVNVNMNVLGAGMAMNALAAIVLAETLEFSLSDVAKRLEGAQLEPGRLQLKHVGKATVIDDTYNSSPEAAKEALSVLRSLPGPHTAILGDMLELGPHSSDYHFELGKQTKDLENVIAIGRMAKYIAEANPKTRYFANIEEALVFLQTYNIAGTILVKASRGMKLERCVAILLQQNGVRS